MTAAWEEKMLAQTLIRSATVALSLAFGGSGIFCLWASFYVPHLAYDAILFLGVATALTLAIPARK